jgi:pimeloyl-ACP methyl ester carboxylesterase
VKADKKGKVKKKVVLFVHGGTMPSVPAYDLPFKDYSWAEYLAQAGFDVFMMDQTGYGFSPRPEMTDPCNTDPSKIDLLIPNPLPEDCNPSYEEHVASLPSDWDEIDSVVEFIRELRGVDRVNLIGWSLGTMRIGGYAALNPEKVDKLYFLAGFVWRFGPGAPDSYPLGLQSYDELMQDRWESFVICDDQIDPEIQPVIWESTMRFDPLGSTWGTPSWNPIASPTGGLMRTRTGTNWSFDTYKAGLVQAPSLLIVGKQDEFMAFSDWLYEDLGTEHKVLMKVDCATHFLAWETQHRILFETSKAWFLHGSIKGVSQGFLSVDANGKIHKE